MALHLTLSLLLVTLAWPWSAESGYDPTKGRGADVSYSVTNGWSLFPPPGSDVSDPNYFISRLDFSILSGHLVTGAADSLYILDASDLSLTHQYNWSAESPKIETCRASEMNNANYSCHNHIRVYHSFPDNSSRLFVCGTQAAIDPECRVVELIVMDGGEVNTTNHPPQEASEGIVSYYPEFSQLGEFRRESASDTVYFSAGFFQGNDGVGRHFSISYQNITMTSDPSTLETTELFRTEDNNIFWLRFPVTFVGSYRADYSPVPPASQASDYQFWFVFLRENFFDSDVIYSHLVRICRNDRGSNTTSDRIFNTYMKARIFCERDKPSGREFTSTLDYQYNSITSFSFSSGRYYGDGDHQKLLYGAFSSPRNGPLGSAICAYPAGNSVETGGDGQTESVFDIFREDLTANPETGGLVENTLVECEAEGRESGSQELVLINPSNPVRQIGTDPLIVLEDTIITKMAVDQVCVVQRDSSVCRNQDVLFLGLDTGKVLKVVFGTEEGGGSFPIIAEEIELDDNKSVNELEIVEVEGEKYLFVATDTRIYKLPLHRCDRFERCMCNDCVASRDPYCVYDTMTSTCTANNLTASGASDTDVPDNILQYIHVDNPPSCDCPSVTFNPTSYTVEEGAGPVGVVILSSQRRGSVSVSTESGSATSDDFVPVSTVVNFTASTTATVYIDIIDDTAFEPSTSFYVVLDQTEDDDVIIIEPMATVTITSNDGSSGRHFQAGFTSSTGCDSVIFNSDLTTSTLTEAVTNGIIDNCPSTGSSCNDFSSSHIIDQSVTWSCDTTQYFTLRGQLLATETASTDELLASLAEWAQKRSEVEVDGQKLTANCSAEGRTLVCPRVTPTKPSGLASSSETTYTEGEFAAVMTLFFISLGVIAFLVVLVVILAWLLRSSRKERYNRVGVSREPSQQTPSSPNRQPTPQTSQAGTPKAVMRLTSYQQAQNTPLVDRDLEFTGFAGPQDTTWSEVKNPAYGSAGILRGDGEGEEGRKDEEPEKNKEGREEEEGGREKGSGVENGDATRTVLEDNV